jgi:hypothetical protein
MKGKDNMKRKENNEEKGDVMKRKEPGRRSSRYTGAARRPATPSSDPWPS